MNIRKIGFFSMVWAALSATFAGARAEPEPLRDKTLVAWVSPADLEQRGGSVLTIETKGTFDALVLGELSPGKWMAGSEGFRRSQSQQDAWPAETFGSQELVQIAISYRGRQITLFRNATALSVYEIPEPAAFPSDALVLMGLRHLDAAPENRYFTGSIEDARIYDSALPAAQLARLKPNEASEPAPLAWWDFEHGVSGDRQNVFRSSTLVGGARVEGGRLWLDQKGAVLLASRSEAAAAREPVEFITRALREKLLQDPYRPGYHFVIPEGQGMPFDPNGAVFWKGRYHLFYIFQDKRGHNWGHVSSTDLFHWRHHPTGLIDGMFSGNCFINAEGLPTMCYHQVGQGNAIAVALDDELNEWKKLDSNPITPKTQPGDAFHDKYRSWDPYGWLEGDAYYAIFGGERAGLVKARSLAGPWAYVGDFLANTVPGVSLTEDISCADFFRLGNRHMLLCISHRLGCRYYLGEWKNEQFHPDFHEMMSWTDNSFFAPESLLDDRGRRIMWAWIFDYPQFKMRTDQGWSGTMSLPRVLSLGDDGRLRLNVPQEIERLRYNGQQRSNLSVASDSELPLAEIKGNSLEIAVQFEPSKARRLGLKVCCSPDGAEETLIYYDSESRKLAIDTSHSSLGDGAKTIESGPLGLPSAEPLHLRVFVDKSVVEVFANGRQAVMRRIYPSRPDSLGVKVFAEGAQATVKTLEAWTMAPSNPY